MLPLARLAGDGLPVPPGLVVPVEVFERALARAGLVDDAERVQRTGRGAEALRLAIAQIELPPSWCHALIDATEALGGPVAVRSSGVEEDGATRSFAGQHASVLGVQPNEIVQAVLQCWASLYAERSLAYRGGGGPRPGALAVLVQRMVPAESSGVMFTVNPLTGSWREMTIEAVWGLAEGLVSGQLSPHWYLLRRPRRTPRPVQRVLARLRLEHLDRDLPELSRRWVLGDDGTVHIEPVPEALRRRPALAPSEARRLARLGLRIEARMGQAQDIEWARTADGRLWILQARPVTASGVAGSAEHALWTRRFIGERFPEPVSPMGWSIVRPVLEHFIAYPSVQRKYLGGGPSLQLVEGRPYVNATVFRHLLFKFPGAAPPRFMLELLPPDEAQRARRRFAITPDRDVYRALLSVSLRERRWRRFAWNPLTNPSAWGRFERDLQAALPEIQARPSSPKAAIALVERQIALLTRYVGVHVCSLLFANLFDQIFAGALQAALPERAADLRRALVVAPVGNRTLQVNAALFDLGSELSDADLSAMEAGELPRGASGDAVRSFLERYGHRSDASWDLFAPRWRQDPSRLVPLLRARSTERVSPTARGVAQAAAFDAARVELMERLTDPATRAAMSRLLDLLRTYLLLRENQRFVFERLQWAMQGTVRFLGEHLVEIGVLRDADHVSWCTWPEVRGVVEGTVTASTVRAAAQRRRARAVQHRRASAPTFLRGDVQVLPPEGATRLQGQGVSAGRVTGAVRRLRSLAEADHLRPGEVLVATAIDPGWTPLFSVAGGVVLELGSRLSHGAVVAREYRVPAVVNVDGALERLADGQIVTVDGTRGIVYVHDSGGPNED